MGFPNLGIALGAGVDELNRQRSSDRADRALQIQEQDAQRRQELRAAQMTDINRRNAERDAAQKVWSDAAPVFQGGWQKAAEHLAERYNANDDGIGYNDGKQVKFQVQPNGVYVTPINADGSGGTTAFYTPQDVMREHIRATHARLAAVNDHYGQQFLGWLDAQAKEATRQAERGEDVAHRDGREAVRDQQFQQELRVKQERNQIVGSRQSSGASLSLAQQRSNAEIDAARDTVAGLAPDELRKRTAKTTDTGRENPDYDPSLARASSLAARRKIGDDDWFDQQTGKQQGQPAPAFDRKEIAGRFRQDRAMDHYRLGSDTPQGVEVLDKSGKVVGHYR